MKTTLINIFNKSHSKIFAVFFVFLLSNQSSFSQSIEDALNSIQGTWEMCKILSTRQCYSPSRISRHQNQGCNYQIKITGNDFILYNKNSEEIDFGEFELENEVNTNIIYTVYFYSSLSDEIFEILDICAKLFIKENDDPLFFMPDKRKDVDKQCYFKRIK